MPPDGKVCSFDCLYCECGLNASRRPHLPRPTRQEVAENLERVLKRMSLEGFLPDVLTFAGNGEPTAHPDFPLIIEDTLQLRDLYCPMARVSVLSNATFAMRPEVHQALLRVDCNILKLDTVSDPYIHLVNRPVLSYQVEEIVRTLASFKGKVIVQTLFMTGEMDDLSVDNTGDVYVLPWLEALKTIKPMEVMVYTLDRETPIQGLRKASREVLDGIAAAVRKIPLPCQVSY